MPSSKAESSEDWGQGELQLLIALGFGPDSVLMNEPKLFVDLPFLAALQRELVDELGEDGASRTLFHIGAIHGLRDAARVADVQPDTPGPVECPPLSMRLGAHRPADPSGADGTWIPGGWPDHFEAEARLSKLGACSRPGCTLSAGYTSGWLSGTLGHDVLTVESTCRAAGDEQCTFVTRDETAWGDEPGAQMHHRLPIASLRAVAGEVGMSDPLSAGQPGASSLVDVLPDQLDPDDPAVHIWGPVMVMPFTCPETALQTMEMLSRDDATREVRVVVLDLCGETLDEGFGSAAVEGLVEHVQSWGAEVILTGISPFSEEAVAELQTSLLLSRKDLPEAIAYAFQIADAQRHLL
jgi:hypothetical protein